MPSLKEVRNRIASIDSTRKITSAMKMVSASKLRRAQQSIVQLRPYSKKLNELLSNLSGSINSDENPLFKEKENIKSVLLIVISSNRGLCGGFNSNILKNTTRLVTTTYKEQFDANKLYFITIGRRATEFISKRFGNIIESHDALTESPSFDKTSEIAEMLIGKFISDEYDRIEIIFHEFKNAASQILTNEVFLPIQPPTTNDKKQFHDYIYQPDKGSITQDLVPKILKLQLYKSLLDSIASEHGARMTAMHKATDNATELLKNLKLVYNKARQASITKEILEIVSGAEALGGQ